MEVLGLDHLYLSVSDLARSEAFYDPVMQLLGFRKGDKAIGGDPHAHYFNRTLQLSLRPARTRSPHDPYAPGLHHLCLQLPTPADVDETVRRLRELGVESIVFDPCTNVPVHDYLTTMREDALHLERVFSH